MNKHSAFRTESLLERAAAIYDFGATLRRASPSAPEPAPVPDSASEEVVEAVAVAPTPKAASRRAPVSHVGIAQIDREYLQKAGFIAPEAPVGGLAEEFRIIKRQLLTNIREKAGLAEDKRQTILICSAQPGDGKTYCAVNLALSLSGERDVEVLLIDGDFNKPEIFPILGLEAGPGLIDAIADPGADVERFVVKTDIQGLSLLSAGRRADNVTELLGSDRTTDVLADLVRDNPRRIILFDSPPALMASPAAVLAAHVGQLVMVVRADRTTEADLREATALLSGCDAVSLVLNGEAFAASGRRFGSYYGYGQ